MRVFNTPSPPTALSRKRGGGRRCERCLLPSLNSEAGGRGRGRNQTFFNTAMPRPYTSVISGSPLLFSLDSDT